MSDRIYILVLDYISGSYIENKKIFRKTDTHSSYSDFEHKMFNFMHYTWKHVKIILSTARFIPFFLCQQSFLYSVFLEFPYIFP